MTLLSEQLQLPLSSIKKRKLMLLHVAYCCLLRTGISFNVLLHSKQIKKLYISEIMLFLFIRNSFRPNAHHNKNPIFAIS